MVCLEGQRQAGQASKTLGPYFISQVSVELKVLMWTDDWSFFPLDAMLAVVWRMGPLICQCLTRKGGVKQGCMWAHQARAA